LLVEQQRRGSYQLRTLVGRGIRCGHRVSQITK
jgi:hypothetical protein